MTHPSFALDGQVALVTGAGSRGGIGFATAALLAELGCSLAVAATGPRIVDRAHELRALAGSVSHHQADLTDPRQAERMVLDVLDAHGRIDVLVNNAGMVQEGLVETFTPVAELSEADWSIGIRRNLDTCFFVTRRVLGGMLERGSGSIINVASVTGPLVATPGESAYAAGKAAMVGLTRTLALEVAGRGVRVNAVAPGWVATDSQSAEEVSASQAAPMGRAARPEEVAAVIAFLAMPGASYVHGAVIVVDGANHLVERLG